MIKYANVLGESIVDGSGIRVVVFLQGCPRHCNGCQNPDLLAIDGGIDIQEKDLVDLILSKVTPLHSGITFSGGDPLLQPESLLKVIMMIHQKAPDLNIWVYTGYLFEDVKLLPVMSTIDVLVDGPFELEKRDLTLQFKGSPNQRIIDVPSSIREEKVILKEI